MEHIKHIIRHIKKLFTLPLLVLFLLTNQKKIIVQDVRRWQSIELSNDTQPVRMMEHNDIDTLLFFLAQYREFRNLYYYRIHKGNSLAVVALYMLQLVYPPSTVLFIRKSCVIGSGLFIQHGFSTVINADIGTNCWINQQVTIGFNDATGKRPRIGNNVRIASGAQILGGITLGDNVIVGANAVVVKDVPPDCVVVGVPAHIIRRNGKRVSEKL